MAKWIHSPELLSSASLWKPLYFIVNDVWCNLSTRLQFFLATPTVTRTISLWDLLFCCSHGNKYHTWCHTFIYLTHQLCTALLYSRITKTLLLFMSSPFHRKYYLYPVVFNITWDFHLLFYPPPSQTYSKWLSCPKGLICHLYYSFWYYNCERKLNTIL